MCNTSCSNQNTPNGDCLLLPFFSLAAGGFSILYLKQKEGKMKKIKVYPPTSKLMLNYFHSSEMYFELSLFVSTKVNQGQVQHFILYSLFHPARMAVFLLWANLWPRVVSCRVVSCRVSQCFW